VFIRNGVNQLLYATELVPMLGQAINWLRGIGDLYLSGETLAIYAYTH